MEFIWVNGEVKKQEEVRISPFDNAFLAGDAVSETLITYDAKPFALGRHVNRLMGSAKQMMMPVSVLEKTPWRPAIDQLMAANRLKVAVLRIVYTSGILPTGGEREIVEPQLYITARQAPFPTMEASLTVVPWLRNERSALVGVGTISNAENIKALHFAKINKTTEALFLNHKGNVCEATHSNVFWLSGSDLYTPALITGCMPGITRGFVMELAPAHGFKVKEVEAPLKTLLKADEVFLTSTLREVQQVTAIGDTAKGTLKNKQTDILREAYKDYIRKNSV